jgi:hypothetical protein
VAGYFMSSILKIFHLCMVRIVILKLSPMFLVVMGLLVVQSPVAVGASASLQMNFRGKLNSVPKCTMTTDPIIISFGEVVLQKLESLKPIPVDYNPVCTNTIGASSYYGFVAFSGTGASFDTDLLATSNRNLAIGLQTDKGTFVKVNSFAMTTNILAWPKLSVKLYRNTNATVSPGFFQAAASLVLSVH